MKAEKEALKKVPPAEFFRLESDKYSQFDEKVIILYLFTLSVLYYVWLSYVKQTQILGNWMYKIFSNNLSTQLLYCLSLYKSRHSPHNLPIRVARSSDPPLSLIHI